MDGVGLRSVWILFQDYPTDRIIDVNEISGGVLGREITRRCGNEGNHTNLRKSGQTTLKFLRTAITVRELAIEAGADLTNAAFIFSLPGREFVIRAGDGDWEFFFSEDDQGEVHGPCVRKGKTKTWFQQVRNGCSHVYRFLCSPRENLLSNSGPLALTEGH